MTSFLKKELCAVRHGSFNVKGDNMIGERQIVHHKMTQEQIAKQLGVSPRYLKNMKS